MGDKYNSSLEGATKLKFAPFCSSLDTLSNESIFFAKVKIFIFSPRTMDYSPWFEFWESGKRFREKDVIRQSISRGTEWHKFMSVHLLC